MHVCLIKSLDALRCHKQNWNDLTRGVPFRSWEWLSSWWEHYGQNRELNVLAVTDDQNQLRGVAPWFRGTSTTRGNVLRWLGSGEVCSEYSSILCLESDEAKVVAAISDWLLPLPTNRNNEPSWDLLELESVEENDSAIAALARNLHARGASLTERPAFNCWRLEHAADWESYLASVSKSHRKQIRRVERGCLDSGRATLRLATTETLDADWATLVDLHQRRRNSLGEPGCFADSRFAGFLRQAVGQLLPKQGARLHILELDGRPVAAEIHLVGGGIAFAYQAGIEPECLNEEPGRMMNIAVLKDSLTLGDKAFDLLRGDEPYKAHWRAQPRPTVNIRIVPPRYFAQLRQGLWLAGDAITGILKASLKRAGLR